MQYPKCEKCGQDAIAKRPGGLPKRFCDKCRNPLCSNCGTIFRASNQQLDTPGWGKFCSVKCSLAHMPMRFKKNGYWCVKSGGHPRAYEKDYYYEHIVVAEQVLGRFLYEGEVVHHIDRDRLNNAPANLEVLSRKDHGSLHLPPISTSSDVGIAHTSFAGLRTRKAFISDPTGTKEFLPYHPLADSNGYVRTCRRIMSEHLGRILEKHEIVRHLNGNPHDNRVENLKLVMRYHSRPRKPKARSIRPKKGWRIAKGYVQIWKPQHPMAAKDGYVMEHRLIISQHLGRVLRQDEVVHHINGNRSDNRLENLSIMSASDHIKTHFKRLSIPLANCQQ